MLRQFWEAIVVNTRLKKVVARQQTIIEISSPLTILSMNLMINNPTLTRKLPQVIYSLQFDTCVCNTLHNISHILLAIMCFRNNFYWECKNRRTVITDHLVIPVITPYKVHR